jgi:DNA ligase-1
MARTNREFLQLAVVHDRAKHRTAGLMMSEKLDGMRAVWIPQARGMKVKDLPFANRSKDTRNHTATGLFSRYGKVIHCPDAFVEGWPNYLLDGELYIGRGMFQPLMSAVKKLEPDWAEWSPVHFHVIDSPTFGQLFADGRINNPQWSHTMKFKECMAALGMPEDRKVLCFEQTYNWLKANIPLTPRLVLHPQRMLPFNTPLALQMMDDTSKEIVDQGGEGLIVRFPGVEWEAIRSPWVFKVKQMQDAEGEVIGVRSGVGKYLGMMGSLTIKWQHGIFELSGFTDEERQLSQVGYERARERPGEMLTTADDEGLPTLYFSRNEVITFKYRELTDGNHPKEARFNRKRIEL